MVSLKAQIAGFSFDNYLMNTVGMPCMTIEELGAVRQPPAGAFVTKTTAPTLRQSNPRPRYRDAPLGSVNSMDLSNQGIDYYLDYLLTLREVHPRRAFFLSLVDMSPDETHMLLKKVQNSGFNGITELNLSYPDVPGKPQVTYDFETTEWTLSGAFDYLDKPLGIELPLCLNIVHFDQAAEVFGRHPLKFINCVNSIGSDIYTEDKSVVIHPKNSFDGIGDQYVKPTALASVHTFYQKLDPPIQTIETGGIYSSRDAFEHILCDASMMQTGTALYRQSVGIFERISLELEAIMAQEDYGKLGDFKDKLKYLA